jgi:hypothetical protein
MKNIETLRFFLKVAIIAFLFTYLYSLFSKDFQRFSNLLGGIFFLLSAVNGYLKYQFSEGITAKSKKWILTSIIFFGVLGVLNLIKYMFN